MYNYNLQLNYRILSPLVFIQKVNTAMEENPYFFEKENLESKSAFSEAMARFANDKANQFIELHIHTDSKEQLSDVNTYLMRFITVKYSFAVVDSKQQAITIYMCC